MQIDRLEVEHEVVRAAREELGGTTLKTLPTVIIGCLEVVPKGGINRRRSSHPDRHPHGNGGHSAVDFLCGIHLKAF